MRDLFAPLAVLAAAGAAFAWDSWANTPEPGPHRLAQSINRLAIPWLGNRGVQAIYEERRNGNLVIVVATLTGKRPVGLPGRVDGLPVVVAQGGPFVAEGQGSRALDTTRAEDELFDLVGFAPKVVSVEEVG